MTDSWIENLAYCLLAFAWMLLLASLLLLLIKARRVPFLHTVNATCSEYKSVETKVTNN